MLRPQKEDLPVVPRSLDQIKADRIMSLSRSQKMSEEAALQKADLSKTAVAKARPVGKPAEVRRSRDSGTAVNSRSPADIDIEFGAPVYHCSGRPKSRASDVPQSPRTPRSSRTPSQRMPSQSPEASRTSQASQLPRRSPSMQSTQSAHSAQSARSSPSDWAGPPPPSQPPPAQPPPQTPIRKSTSGQGPPPPSQPPRLPPPPATLPPAAARSAQSVYQEMLACMQGPEAERKSLLRDLQRKWHPDKNTDDFKEIATNVFQYINSISQTFLAGPDQSLPVMREYTEPKYPTSSK